jgi:hypothetical protein
MFNYGSVYFISNSQSVLAVRECSMSTSKFNHPLKVSLNFVQVASAQAVNLFVSCLTLVLIAMDRFLLTLCPVKWRLAAKAPLAFYLVVWLTALFVALPYFFAVHAETVDNLDPWNMPNIDALVSI